VVHNHNTLNRIDRDLDARSENGLLGASSTKLVMDVLTILPKEGVPVRAKPGTISISAPSAHTVATNPSRCYSTTCFISSVNTPMSSSLHLNLASIASVSAAADGRRLHAGVMRTEAEPVDEGARF